MDNMNTNYELLKNYEDPSGKINKGTVKPEVYWLDRFALLKPGDCAIKIDWFKEENTPVKVLRIIDHTTATLAAPLTEGEEAIIVTGTKGMTVDHMKERVESAFAQKAENLEWETPANLKLSKIQITRIGLGIKKLINEELKKD